MAPLALFGIENDVLNLVVDLLALSLFVVYAALVFWTFADARRRINDSMLVGCATAASLFPFIGTVVYLIVRPPEYLDDVHERELEIAAAEARLASVRRHTCRHCDFDVEPSFLRCPSCLRRLKEPCTVCGRPLDPRWKICPYCEAEVGKAPAQPRRRERKVARAPAGAAAGSRAGVAAARQPAQARRQAPQGGKPATRPARAASPATQRSRPAPRPPDTHGRTAERPPATDGGTAERPPSRLPTADGDTAERPPSRPPTADGDTAERPPSRPPTSG